MKKVASDNSGERMGYRCWIYVKIETEVGQTLFPEKPHIKAKPAR